MMHYLNRVVELACYFFRSTKAVKLIVGAIYLTGLAVIGFLEIIKKAYMGLGRLHGRGGPQETER